MKDTMENSKDGTRKRLRRNTVKKKFLIGGDPMTIHHLS
jgi:hypothetical protein